MRPPDDGRRIPAVGAPDMSIQGVDFDRYSTVSGAALAEAGYSFVINQLGSGSSGTLTPALAAEYTRAGLDIVSVYASTARVFDNAWLGYDTTLASQLAGDAASLGYQNGYVDGRDALAYATGLQQTPGSAIYFIADPEARAGIAYDLSYYRGIAAALGENSPTGPLYAVGVYGSGMVLDAIHGAGLATYRWLAAPQSWAGSAGYTDYDIAQHGKADIAAFPGQVVIRDTAADDGAFGQWSVIDSSPDPTGTNTDQPVSRPNLVINDLTLPKVATAPGEQAKFAFAIGNIGDSSAAASAVRVYLSTDDIIGADDTLLGSFALPALAAGVSAAGSITATIPQGIALGGYHIGVIVDAVPNETQTTNNAYVLPFTLGAVTEAGPAPDLVINYLALRVASVAVGGQQTATFEIGNAGATAAAASTARIYLSSDATLSAADTLLGSIDLPALTAGGAATGTLAFTIPAGTWHVGIVASQVAGEINVGNNAYAVPLTVTATALPAPNLVINDLALSAPSAQAGDAATIGFEVGNAGTAPAGATTARVYLSTDATISAADTLLGSFAIPALASGAAAARSLAASIPTGTAPGSYFIGVLADPVAGEASINDNAFARGVTILAAAGAVSIANVTVIEGDSFTTTATFVVTRTGGTAAFSVQYATSDGGATVADGDYAATTGTLYFAAGVNTQTIAVTVNGDAIDESASAQTFHVALSAPTGGATLAVAKGTATILDDDAPNQPPLVGVQDIHVRPGSAIAAALMITETRAFQGNTITRYAFRDDGSAGGYFSIDGTAQAAGLWIPVTAADLGKVAYFGGDTPGAETVGIGVFDGTVWSASGTLTATTQIDNSDDFGNSALTAGRIGANGVMAGTIETAGDEDWFATTLTAGVTYRFDLQGRASDTGALAAPKLALFDSNANIISSGGGAADASLSFEVPASGTYYLAASGTDDATGAYRLGVTAVSPTLVGLAALDARKPEGNDGTTRFTFTASRSGVTTGETSVAYAVTGIGPRPATGSDFIGGALPTGTIHFLAGETTRTIGIDVAGDTTAEADETFLLSLQSLSADVLLRAGATSASGTIQADDAITDLAIIYSQTGLPFDAVPRFYDGAVAGLEKEIALITPENVNASVSGDNWFVKTGAGTDALAAHGGRNVLDGGAGSNFLTGASGEDSFFLDTRGPSDVWSTVVGFGSGDSATVWGVTAADFALTWQDGLGAVGFQGLTLHATSPGRPDAMLTFAGYTQADLDSGRLQMSFGAIDPSSPYLYFYGASV